MRLTFMQFQQRRVTSIAAKVNSHAVKTHYAFYAAQSTTFDTVGIGRFESLRGHPGNNLLEKRGMLVSITEVSS